MNRGDIPAVIDLVDPEFVWTEPPEVVGAGGGRGRAEFEIYLQKLLAFWAEFRCAPVEHEQSGERVVVVVLQEAVGRYSGVRVQQWSAHLWTMRGSEALRMECFLDKREALELLRWGGERLFARSAPAPSSERPALEAAAPTWAGAS